jgi:glycerophosphoryl diester phosphodiesterase
VPRYVVHRGGAALWPENTLLAFRNAIALGAQTLELDVHGTADGDVAVIHDPTVDRTTNGSGPVGRLTVADLRRLRIKAADGRLTDEWVPTLGEVLAVAAPAGVAMLVEVKTPDAAVTYERVGRTVHATPGPRYEGLEARVLAQLREAGVVGRSILMAFNPAVVAAIHTLAPSQMTALLVDRRHVESVGASSTEPVEWAARAGANVLGIHYSVCDAGMVAAARAAGIALGVYTVNDEADLRRLAALGVDVIISDRADLATKLQGER